MKKILALLCFLPLLLAAQTHPLKGKVTDKNHRPIEYAAIMMQTTDSAYICSTTTDSLGCFTLPQSRARFIIIAQQLSYLPFAHAFSDKDDLTIELTEKENVLNEVVVKANRPLVKAEDGKLNYDLSVLSEKKVVSNVYEALTKLPGISESKGALQLAGASGLTVIMNGKPTTMTDEQLKTLLQSMPVDRVEKAEVMYSAPPQYHIRGAAINIVLKHAKVYSLQGEAKARYTNQYFSSYDAGANLIVTTPKLSFDFMYNTGNYENMQRNKTISEHTLNTTLYDIRQDQRITSKGWRHNLRSAFDFNLSDQSNLSVAYTGSFSPNGKMKSMTDGNYQSSLSNQKSDAQMHNISAQYKSGFGLNIGMDYTNYHSSGNQHLNSETSSSTSTFYLINGQNINRINLTADQDHQLKRNWNLGYGASYSYANDRDHQFYQEVKGIDNVSDTRSRLEEQTTDFYFKIGKDNASGTSFSLSATGEYYTIGNYHKWAFFPQASLSYTKTPNHIFQFSFASQKQYPGYWQMQPFETYIDAYAVVQGTPGLRPASNYSMTTNYILKQRYVFTLFWERTNDYFQQAAYQSNSRLMLIYKTQNWNYSQQYGINIVIPLKYKSWLDTKLELTGLNMRQKCDNYFDIPFDRGKWLGLISLNNTFIAGKGLSFELNGNCQSKAIQGTYDINGIYNIDAAAKWSFCKGRATLSARFNDILNSGMPKVKVRFKGQYLDMDTGYYTRNIEVRFAYRFGGYKEKKGREVDTSRFGH